MTSTETAAHALVYQALDQILMDGSVAAASRRAVYRAVDTMRTANGRAHDLRLAENISIQMHKLDWALCRNDQSSITSARELLKELAKRLLQSRVADVQGSISAP